MSTNLHLVWAHGKDSTPWGTKSLFLKEVAASLGVELSTLDCQDTKDPDVRAARMVEYLQDCTGPIALVGSSMGGYVSLAASKDIDMKGLFLLAPAIYLPGYYWIDFPWLKTPVTIVHGWQDEIVPIENIFRFARVHRTQLHVFNAEHRLHDVMDEVGLLFKDFLQNILNTL